MFWQSGDNVYLKHTHQWGVFARLLDGDMAMVFLSDQEDEIPVHLDDLDYKAPPVIPAPVKEKKPPTDRPAPNQAQGIRGTVQSINGGVFLVLTTDPEEMDARQFYVFLLNDHSDPLTFSGEIRIGDHQVTQKAGTLSAGEWIELIALPMDRLHQQPEILIQSKPESDPVEYPPFVLKPRPKSLFQKMRPNEYFSFPAALYPLPVNSGGSKNLDVYTKRPLVSNPDRRRIHTTPAPLQRASFKTELDLHAEQLFANPGKVSPADIFRRQMETFEHYLQQAIQIGVPHVFIIHGLGKGKLRQAIADRSLTYSSVAQVRNDYHPKYGFGASEIVLK